MKREQWNTKAGFIIAAIGSAVGLGNLWRFPYIAASNGGGAFVFPYLFAIITAGIPILILEYTMGKTYQSGAPGIFAKINKKFEWLGWLQIMTAFLIAIYYFAIVVWVLSYLGFSFGSRWGDDTEGFFYSFIGICFAQLVCRMVDLIKILKITSTRQCRMEQSLRGLLRLPPMKLLQQWTHCVLRMNKQLQKK